MDIKEFLDNFGIDESSLKDKDKQKLINAIQDNKDSIAYGVYKKSSADPISRKVFLDKYNTLKTKSPEQLMSEVIQGTVDNKNISNAMQSEYTPYPYEAVNTVVAKDSKMYKPYDATTPYLGEQSDVARNGKLYINDLITRAKEQMLPPDNGNTNLDGGLGAAPQDPTPGDDAATKQLQRNTLIDKVGSDMKSAPWTNAGIGASSIALSQMQGNGLVGTGVNLAAALGGSMAGEQYLGKALGNSTIARVGGGLAGHTIGNILMGLFRNPQEQQLLNQGMQYAQQNT